jgi:hypothetical protein
MGGSTRGGSPGMAGAPVRTRSPGAGVSAEEGTVASKVNRDSSLVSVGQDPNTEEGPVP